MAEEKFDEQLMQKKFKLLRLLQLKAKREILQNNPEKGLKDKISNLIKMDKELAKVRREFFKENPDAFEYAIESVHSRSEEMQKEFRRMALPAIGQTLLTGGASTGVQVLRGVGGALLGESASQAIDIAQGAKENPDLGQLASEGIFTAVGEGASRIPFNLFFKRGLDYEALTKKSVKLGKMKQTLDAASDTVKRKVSEITGVIDKHLAKVKDQVGPVGSLLKRWKRILVDQGDEVGSGVLAEFETNLNQVLKFVDDDAVRATIPKKPLLNTAGKNIRKEISDIVDQDAERAGIVGFSKLSGEVSELIRRTSKRPSLIGRAIESGAFGTAVGISTQNPLLGIGATLAGIELSRPSTRLGLLRAIGGKRASDAAAVGLSQLFRTVRPREESKEEIGTI